MSKVCFIRVFVCKNISIINAKLKSGSKYLKKIFGYLQLHKCKIVYTCSVCFLHKQLCSFLCKISGLEKFRNLELSNSSYTLFGLNLRSVGSGGAWGHGPPQILQIDQLTLFKPRGADYAHPFDTCPHPTGFSALHTALQPSNWHTFIQSVLSYKKTDKKTDNMQNQIVTGVSKEHKVSATVVIT